MTNSNDITQVNEILTAQASRVATYFKLRSEYASNEDKKAYLIEVANETLADAFTAKYIISNMVLRLVGSEIYYSVFPLPTYK